MRDEHRFREKIELSLENRHVAGIAFAAVLFLAAAFSLGLLVGKRLSSRAAVPAPVDDLAALDARQRAAAVPARPPPPSAVRAEAAETPKLPDSATAAAAPLPTAESSVLAPAAPARPAPVRSIAPPPGATRVAPGARTAQVTAPQTAVLPAPPANPGKFTVQVGATQDRAEARALVVRAAKAGLRPYVAEVKLPGRGLWYRVRVGAFPDRTAADQYRKDVERE